MRSCKRLLMNVANVITRWNRIAKMKKTILTAIALLCLSTPLQAKETSVPLPSKEMPCFVLGAPCRIKHEIILRKEPNEDSPIVYKQFPIEDDGRYFIFEKREYCNEKACGYFTTIPTLGLILGNTIYVSGWAPLDNAVHDIRSPLSFESELYIGQVSMEIYEPGFPVYTVETKNSFLKLPLNLGYPMKLGNSIQKLEKLLQKSKN